MTDLPVCPGCGNRYRPEPGAPFICESCAAEDELPTERTDYDIPLFPIGTGLWGRL